MIFGGSYATLSLGIGVKTRSVVVVVIAAGKIAAAFWNQIKWRSSRVDG
jgi:hypothetical protein